MEYFVVAPRRLLPTTRNITCTGSYLGAGIVAKGRVRPPITYRPLRIQANAGASSAVAWLPGCTITLAHCMAACGG